MKYSIESIGDQRVKASLFLDGKNYVEIWIKLNDEYYVVESFDILSQLETDGIDVENTDIGEFIASIDINAFMSCIRK